MENLTLLLFSRMKFRNVSWRPSDKIVSSGNSVSHSPSDPDSIKTENHCWTKRLTFFLRQFGWPNHKCAIGITTLLNITIRNYFDPCGAIFTHACKFIITLKYTVIKLSYFIGFTDTGSSTNLRSNVEPESLVFLVDQTSVQEAVSFRCRRKNCYRRIIVRIGVIERVKVLVRVFIRFYKL